LPDGTESKIKGYADDTNLCLRDLESIQELFKTLELYSKATEAKLNKDETKILLAGSLKDNEKDLENLDLKCDEKLKIYTWCVGRNT
jgi:hypothetical protein